MILHGKHIGPFLAVKRNIPEVVATVTVIDHRSVYLRRQPLADIERNVGAHTEGLVIVPVLRAVHECQTVFRLIHIHREIIIGTLIEQRQHVLLQEEIIGIYTIHIGRPQSLNSLELFISVHISGTGLHIPIGRVIFFRRNAQHERMLFRRRIAQTGLRIDRPFMIISDRIILTGCRERKRQTVFKLFVETSIEVGNLLIKT